jgi:lipopolysaccharide transport system permease protein
VPFTYRLLILPLLMLLTTLLSLAVGMWTSALNVKYRDVGVALPVLTMLWMFASPVVYPSSIVYSSVSSTTRFLYSLNPLVGIIDNFRAALLGRPFNWPALCATAIVTAISLVFSAYHFRRMEREFADIV